MPRKTHVKQYGQGGKTRGRHKHVASAETKAWKRMSRSGELKWAA